MTAFDDEVTILFRIRVDRFLFLADGSRRLDDQAEDDGHAVGDTAIDAAVVIGPGLDDIAVIIKVIIGLGTAEVCQGKAVAKIRCL